MAKYFKNVKSIEDLKSQFRKLAIAHHPDRGGDVEVMKMINIEYDALFPIWKDKHEQKTGEHLNETAESTRREFYTQYGWEGSRYDSSLSTKEIAATIRTYCKEKYPTWKFSVTSSSFSGGSSIDVAVMEAPQQIFDLEACRSAYNQYLEDEKIGYYGRRGLSINIEKMLAEDSMYWQIHKPDDRIKPYFTECGFTALKDVYDFMESYNYDDSDSMIDYFDCNFYSSFDIGKWNKPFRIIPKTARIKSAAPEIKSVVGNDYYTVTKSKHTKTGADIWLVKVNQTLTKEEYIVENKKMRELGGYYSKFTHSFVFNEDPTDSLTGQTTITA